MEKPADAPPTTPEPPINLYRRLLPYLKPHRTAIVSGLLLLLLTIPADNFHPIAWKNIVDNVLGGDRSLRTLGLWVGAMFAVQAVAALLGALRSNLLEKVGQRLVYDLRNDVYAKL